jgi:hypothetical protein
VTRGKGVRPSGEHAGDLVPVYFAEITSVTPEWMICAEQASITYGDK